MAFEFCLYLIHHVGRPVVHAHVGVTVRPRRERAADLAVGEAFGRRVLDAGNPTHRDRPGPQGEIHLIPLVIRSGAACTRTIIGGGVMAGMLADRL